MRSPAIGFFALAVVAVAAAPALAQAPPIPPSPRAFPPPGPGVVPPYRIMRTVRAAGFDPLTPPIREGSVYVLRANDFRGVLMRVVVDARTGAIRDANRILSGPGPYGPPPGRLGMIPAAPPAPPADVPQSSARVPHPDVPPPPFSTNAAAPPPAPTAAPATALPLPRPRPAEPFPATPTPKPSPRPRTIGSRRSCPMPNRMWPMSRPQRRRRPTHPQRPRRRHRLRRFLPCRQLPPRRRHRLRRRPPRRSRHRRPHQPSQSRHRRSTSPTDLLHLAPRAELTLPWRGRVAHRRYAGWGEQRRRHAALLHFALHPLPIAFACAKAIDLPPPGGGEESARRYFRVALRPRRRSRSMTSQICREAAS